MNPKDREKSDASFQSPEGDEMLPPEATRDEIQGSPGVRKKNLTSDWDQNILGDLFEEGNEEAVHDEMIADQEKAQEEREEFERLEAEEEGEDKG